MIDFVELRLYTSYAATQYSLLQNYTSLTFDVKYNEVGAIDFEYPLDDAKLVGLTDQSLIGAVCGFSNGTVREVERFVIEGTDDTKVADDTRLLKVNGRSTLGVYMEDATVYPSNWPTTSPSGHEFVNNNCGTIMRTLMQRAKARGCFPFLDETTFSGTSDSSGAPWAAQHTQNYATGTTYLQILKDFMELGYLDAWVDGNQLKLRNGTARGTHIGIGTVELRPAHNVSEMITQTKSAESATTVLIEGDEGTAVERHRAAFQTTLGRRRERYTQAGGVADSGVLTLLADADLEQHARIEAEETLGVSNLGLTPFLDFDIADWVWVRYDTDQSAVERRVRQIAVAVDDAGAVTLGLTLNSILYEGDVALQRRMDQYTGKGGSYGSIPNSQIDITTPEPPIGGSITAGNYWDPKTRSYTGAFVVNWTAPTLNVDGTALDDLDHYEVVWRYKGTTDWSSVLSSNGTATTLGYSPVSPGRTIEAMVRAVDKNANASDWSAIFEGAVPADVTPPPKPSTPSAESRLGSIRAFWDGKDATGAEMPEDFWYVSVHLGPDANFIPSDANQAATIDRNAPTQVIVGTNLAYGSTHWVRLVPYDVSGNKGAASDAVSVTVKALVETDIIGEVINGANIVDGSITASDKVVANSITSALVQALAINTGHLAANAVTADKIQAGAIEADKITVGANGGFNLLFNGSFEDTTPGPVEAPKEWYLSVESGSNGTLTVDTNSIAGTKAAQVTINSASDALYLRQNRVVPVVPGATYYCRVRFRLSRDLPAGKGPSLAFSAGATEGGTGPWLGGQWSGVDFNNNQLVTAGTVHTLQGRVTVSSTGKFGSIYVYFPALGDGSGSYSVTVDDAVMSVAVTDNQITEIGPGKITTGTLDASVRIIAGTDGAARTELTGTGFRAYNGSNQQMFEVRSSNGETFIGNPSSIHVRMGAYANAWASNISQAQMRFAYPGSGWNDGQLFSQYWWEDNVGAWGALRLVSPSTGDEFANSAFLDVRQLSGGKSQFFLRATEANFSGNTFIWGSGDASSIDFRTYGGDGFQFSDFGQTSRLRLLPQPLAFTIRAANSDGSARRLVLQGAPVVFSANGAEVEYYYTGFMPMLAHFGRNVALSWGASSTLRVTNYADSVWHTIQAAAFQVMSDPRLKDDAQPVEGALDAVKRLGVYDYKMQGALPRKTPKSPKTQKVQHPETGELVDQVVETANAARGVMADEVRAVLPDAVNEDERGELSVNLYDLLATTIAAVKELAQEVEDLRAVRGK